MKIPWENIEDISELANYIEFYILAEKKPLSKSDVSFFMQQMEEADIDSCFAELENRVKKYHTFSPYRVEEHSSVCPNETVSIETHPEYMMCLLFSINGAQDQYKATHFFEEVVAESLKCHLGEHSKVKVIGCGKRLCSIISDICTFLSTRQLDEVRTEDSDGGVDVIAMVPFHDDMPGKLTILTDCASGYHWNEKQAIKMKKWGELIRWGNCTPIPSISIPHIIDQDTWIETLKTYGLVLDRARILNGLYSNHIHSNDYLTIRNNVKQWCLQEIYK